MERYIEIKAIITNKGEIIPFFDDRLEFEEKEDISEFEVYYDCNWYRKFQTVIFDLKKNKVRSFVEVEVKAENTLKRKIGEEVYVDSGNRKIVKTKISGFDYKPYNSQFYKGDKIPPYLINFVENPDSKIIYKFNISKPSYVFENRMVNDYEHNFYTIEN